MLVDIAITPVPGDSTQTATFYGSVGPGPPFLIGSGTTYQSSRGLVNEHGVLLYDPARYSQFGQWAQLIDCTCVCESHRVLTCLNTYDRARFTFGCLQFAAHVPDGDFVKWFRSLLQRSDADSYFPDLAVVNGRICHTAGGGQTPLESAQSSAGLMTYLNADPTKVDAAETLAAARLIYWSMREPAVGDAQVDVGASIFRTTIASRANQLGLDGRPDYIIAVVMDILHQGRGSIGDIEAALAGSATETQLDRLLGVGAASYPTRCATLRDTIEAKRQAGSLGTHVYDGRAKDFRVQAQHLAAEFEMLSRVEVTETGLRPT